MSVRPVKAQISLGIRPVWSESSLSAWRKLGSLATHWAPSKGSDQTGRMPRLIWVFVGHTVTFLVLSCRTSYCTVSKITDQPYAVLIVRVAFLFGVLGRMWNSIVSVPEHCLFIYFSFLCNCSIQFMVGCTFSIKVMTSSWFLQYGAYTFFISSARMVKHVPTKRLKHWFEPRDYGTFRPP